jgi:hypothetical protein
MKNFIRILFFLMLSAFVFSCTIATNDTIIGTWKSTHMLSIPISSEYYKFNADKSYYKSSSQSNLTAALATSVGTYTLDSTTGNMILSKDSGYTWKVYLIGTTMYWYLDGIETYRFSKQ